MGVGVGGSGVFAVGYGQGYGVWGESGNWNTSAGIYGLGISGASGGYGGIFQSSSNRPPLRVVPRAEPSNPQDGDIYYDSGTNKLRVRASGAWANLH